MLIFFFLIQINGISLKPEEIITSFDVVGLFTYHQAVHLMFTKHLRILHSNQANLSCNQICDLLHLCLDNTYFSYNGQLYQQCHGCSMGSPVFPIVTCMWNNLNI